MSGRVVRHLLVLVLLSLGLGPAALSVAAAGTVVVTAYGATGNAITNDTAAFQRAIAALDAMGGGTLAVPAGHYLVDPDAINVHQHTVVSGSGATLLASRAGYTLLDLSGTAIEVDGLMVDGASHVLHAVEIEQGATQIHFSGVTVQNAGQPSDPADPSYSAPTVGIRVQGDGQGMLFDRVNVRNVVATHSDGTSMIARGLLLDSAGGSHTVSKNVTISNSAFYEVGPKDDGDCIVIQNSSDTDANLSIVNSTFDGCHKRAVKLQVGGVTVKNNRILNPFHGDNAYRVRPETYDPSTGKPTFDMFSAIGVLASNVKVIQNVALGTGSFYQGIKLDGGAALHDVAITGNGVTIGPGSEIGAPSSLVRSSVSVNNLTITYNAFGNAPYGIYLEQPVTRAIISCNVYVDVAHQTATPYGTETACTPPAS